jgi:hypothetical protein
MGSIAPGAHGDPHDPPAPETGSVVTLAHYKCLIRAYDRERKGESMAVDFDPELLRKLVERYRAGEERARHWRHLPRKSR